MEPGLNRCHFGNPPAVLARRFPFSGENTRRVRSPSSSITVDTARTDESVMAVRPLQTLIGRLRRAVTAPAGDGLGDADLLDRWVQRRDEAAFEVLLWRHGPLVLSVCRRLLRDAQDAEDAFQATFLTLLRKAPSIRRRESVAGWLYRVAYRVAVRAGAARRATPERLLDDVPAEASEAELLWRDLRPVLDEEVNGLPVRYRTAFVLCYLQGKTNAEAAAEIGIPIGTVLSRLNWARQRLRQRLTRRGLTLSAALLAVVLTEKLVPAALPAVLVQTTFQAGLAFATGQTAGGAVSAKVLTLTQEVLRAMRLAKLKMMVVLVAVMLTSLGAGALAYQSWAAEPGAVERKIQTPEEQRPARTPVPQRPVEPPQKDSQDAPSRQEGILLVIGSELGEKDKCEPEREIKVKVGDTVKRFRKLKVGDKVEADQMLGLMDPSLAIDDMAIAQSKLEAIKADFEAAVKTADEAMERYKTQLKLKTAVNAPVSDEEIRGVKLTSDRYRLEAVSKREAVKTAELELKKAQTVLRTHEIRSAVNGTITNIYYRPGEAVKKFEPVVRIKINEEER
jgi:RNA polymerase sigma factor (sigma-70 family)